VTLMARIARAAVGIRQRRATWAMNGRTANVVPAVRGVFAQSPRVCASFGVECHLLREEP
jgi:hypothetical protein